MTTRPSRRPWSNPLLVCVLGAGLVVVGFREAAHGTPLAVLAVAGIWVVGRGVEMLGGGRDWPLVLRSSELLSAGQLEEAEAILERLPSPHPASRVRGAVQCQRAVLALCRGDLRAAAHHATEAIDGRRGVLWWRPQRVQIVTARAIRALAYALRDDPRAAEDIVAVRAAPSAPRAALARASVAEAVCLARAGDLARLAELLERDRQLLLRSTTPRDRAVVNDLQRSLFAREVSPYRAGPSLPPEHRRIDAEGQRSSNGPPPPEGGTRRRTPDRYLPVLAFVLAAIPLAYALYPVARRASVTLLLEGGLVFGTALVLGALGIRQRRIVAALGRATELVATGESEQAERLLRPLLGVQRADLALRIRWLLATVLAERAQFAEALSLVEEARERGSRLVAAPGSAAVQFVKAMAPVLSGQRAHLLAVLGREDDAMAELGTLPASRGLDGMRFVTRFAIALRRGDFEGALVLSAGRSPDLPVGAYYERLLDILSVAREAHPAIPELERLRADLRASPELRGWLAAVWPDGEAALEDARARAA